MRGAAGIRALSISVVLVIAWVSLRGCLAEHQPGGQTFLKDTFKAVILRPHPSSLSASTTATTTTSSTTTASARTATLGRPASEDTLSSKEREAEADALAADLVQSLSDVLLRLDRRWVKQQQQRGGTDIHSPPQGSDVISPPQGTNINYSPQGTDISSPPQGTGLYEAVAVARRKSLWKELGLPALAGEDTLGAAVVDADAGVATATDAGKAAAKPAEKSADKPAGLPAGSTAPDIAARKAAGVEGRVGTPFFEPGDAWEADTSGAAVAAALEVGGGDTSQAPVSAVAAAVTAEGAGRQRLRGDKGQQEDAAIAAAAAVVAEGMAEGFLDEKWGALGSRGLVVEEPFPFGGGGDGGGGVAGAAFAEGSGGEEDFLKIDSVWVNVALTFVCVVCAGLAAGLTMGLLSIEPLEMAIKQRSGTAEEQRQAKKILPLVSQHHFLLVTLLLFNSLANEALPIFLDNLVPSWLAVILSVSLVLFFGEIVPSAVFTGKGRLAIAAGMSWFVSGLMFLLAPVAWPIAWALDRVLGIEGLKRYNRAEIAALVEVQHELSTEDVTNLPLHADEVSIVNGVLQTAVKSVSEAMITMDKVFCLSRNEKLSANTMADIMAAGYSRVLVYEGEDTRNIRGYLQVKKLIVLDPDDERDISTLMLRIPVVVSPTKSLLDLLNTFQTGRSHLALVSHSPAITLESLKHGVRLEGAARPVGIITLEDIIEEILQEEIMDESDRLTQFIEDRAKDTLLRFTRMRQQRHIMGRYSTVAINSPKENSLLLKLSSSGSTPARGGGPPPSPFFSRLDSEGGGVSVDSLSLSADPPAAPGLGERARLLSSTSRPLSGSHRRLLPGGKPTKREGSTTVAEAMMAAAQRTRESDDAAAAAASAARGAGGDPKKVSLFKQSSTGSVNNGDVSGRDDHDQDSEGV